MTFQVKVRRKYPSPPVKRMTPRDSIEMQDVKQKHYPNAGRVASRLTRVCVRKEIVCRLLREIMLINF